MIDHGWQSFAKYSSAGELIPQQAQDNGLFLKSFQSSKCFEYDSLY